jgi:site-specific DNA-methyltransferase (adenine-specific)
METIEGETVLDPFFGSGTTALACRNTNRKFIGSDTEQKYVEMAKNRLSE